MEHLEFNRLGRLVLKAIEKLSLNLEGLTVYTEAGTDVYAVTAPLAAMAGAKKVIALARPWNGLSAEEVGMRTKELSKFLKVDKYIKVVTRKSLSDIAKADIITNLGFVRPIDHTVIKAMKPTAVIPYMREAWEVRHEDVDLAACREYDIPVFATNESHPEVKVFDFCGLLAAKLLFESGIEIAGTFILIASKDPFGLIISKYLRRLGAKVLLLPDLDHERLLSHLPSADALIIADFLSPEMLIGRSGVLDAKMLAKTAPGLTVIAFAGGVDGRTVSRAGLCCIPKEGCKPKRMSRTLHYLGALPIITLHAAGLKVGVATVQGRKQGLSGRQLSKYVCSVAPAAEIDIKDKFHNKVVT